MFVIRRAKTGDAGQLSRLAEQTFRATFGSVNTSENMELFCNNHYSEEIQSAEIANPSMLTLLCESREMLMAFAQLRWGANPACVSARSSAEIQRFYVADQWHGNGVAQALMRNCVDEALARGSDAIWLGVWEHNPRAIAFYKKSAFVEVGDHVFTLGHDLQRDIVMVKSISDNANVVQEE